MKGDPEGIPPRHRSMGERVLREARTRGVPGPGTARLERGLDLAMAPRLALLADDHDPRLLHPGRTVILLLQDTPERDPLVLTAAALLESDDGGLRVSYEAIQNVAGQEVASIIDRIPVPSGGGPVDPEGSPETGHRDDTRHLLLEALLDLPVPLARVALAERLDHLRHLHLEGDMGRRRRLHREAEEVYAPLAPRVDPVLGRRYEWWCRMFARRHLPAEGG